MVNGSGLSSGTAGEPCKFSIHAPSSQKFSPSSCSVAFEGPSKPKIEFETTKTSVACSWTPVLPGNYRVYVRYSGEDIPGSPFNCKIEGDLSESSRPTRIIKCIGDGLISPELDFPNEVIIDGAQGVVGGLSTSMEGPGRPELSFKNNPDGTLSLFFKASVSGTYILNIKFMGQHVSGSPFTLKMT
jgi:filamin-B